MIVCLLLALQDCSDQVPRVSDAKQYYVAPDGAKANPGTREKPWDFASAVSGSHNVPPGSVIWVRAGRYKQAEKFVVRLGGKEGAPVHLRAYPGERATVLDTMLSVEPGADHLWIWDLELTGSLSAEKRVSKEKGSSPKDIPLTSGIWIAGGKGGKFVNLVIHDNPGGGMAWWTGATDGEVHGCIIYGNGWTAPDRGHGHCIYTQNRDGTKTVSGNIMTVPFDGQYTLHAYGSARAFVDNYVAEDNIAFGKGPFLIGGGSPSHNIKVSRNWLQGVDMRLGYGAENEDCELRGNVVAKGRIAIQKFKKVVDEGNVRDFKEAKAVLIPNKYDPRRAHVAVFNRATELNVKPMLKKGDSFRLVDALDFYGKPVLEGKCSGETIKVPSTGEFVAYVLLKE